MSHIYKSHNTIRSHGRKIDAFLNRAVIRRHGSIDKARIVNINQTFYTVNNFYNVVIQQPAPVPVPPPASLRLSITRPELCAVDASDASVPAPRRRPNPPPTNTHHRQTHSHDNLAPPTILWLHESDRLDVVTKVCDMLRKNYKTGPALITLKTTVRNQPTFGQYRKQFLKKGKECAKKGDYALLDAKYGPDSVRALDRLESYIDAQANNLLLHADRMLGLRR